MPTEILAVTSLDTNWTNNGGATRTISVAKPDDADTTYISILAGVGFETVFDVANTALTSETINSVTVRARERVTVGTDTASAIRMSDNGFVNNVTQSPSLTTTYTDFVGCTSVTAPSGGAWMVAKLNALQVSLIGADFGVEQRCTSLSVEVDWTAAATGGPGISGGEKFLGFRQWILSQLFG